MATNIRLLLVPWLIVLIPIFILWYFNILNIGKNPNVQFIFPNKKKHNVMDKNEVDIKYILQWTSPKNVPFVYMGTGQSGFIERKCPYTNCFVTDDKSYLGDYSKFDVIVFAGPEVVNLHSLPKKRSPHQKYVFASIESSDNYPVCSNRFDGYFNWTWTFKLDSEVRWGYFTIRDKNNTIIGPNKQMNWLKLQDMDPVSDKFKQQLKTKTKAAAWFVSNCYTRSRREKLVIELRHELQNYNMTIDIHGNCDNFQCSVDNENDCSTPQCDIDIDNDCDHFRCSRERKGDCNELLKEDYYFYLAFENSFGEDYVTEELLRALNNNAVPIVYGAANYTRFMPDGIYLNAGELSINELVLEMYKLINDFEQYSEYFKWKNHYTYHRQQNIADTDPQCLICAHLNNKNMMNNVTVYENFRKWWNPPGRCAP